jgi:hypothetical protein
MPQEVVDCVNQLGKADRQSELLTFYDRKRCLIGNSQTPGVPDAPQVTNTIPEEDGIGDLNPPTANYGYGLDKENNID